MFVLALFPPLWRRVIDPRVIELVDAPHIHADYHLALRPGANVAVLNALQSAQLIRSAQVIAEYERIGREPIDHDPVPMEAETG